jgi:hypothetical protein
MVLTFFKALFQIFPSTADVPSKDSNRLPPTYIVYCYRGASLLNSAAVRVYLPQHSVVCRTWIVCITVLVGLEIPIVTGRLIV